LPGAQAAYRIGMVGLPYGGLCGGTLTGKYFDKTKPQVLNPKL
jgi:hypothetical protein